MSLTLNKFLKDSGSISVKLNFLKTKHYSITATINGKSGKFILDTGASNSCICTSLEKKFNIISKETIEKASSATSEISNTKISKNNSGDFSFRCPRICKWYLCIFKGSL